MTDDRPGALGWLDALAGRWDVSVDNPHIPGTLTGTMTAEWQEGTYLVLRSHADHPDAPDSLMIIGVDDTTDACTVLYSDERGVHRIYQMRLADGVWRQWRDAPGFAQRFTGTFDGPDTIRGKWEICLDGITWEHDFEMTYRRA